MIKLGLGENERHVVRQLATEVLRALEVDPSAPLLRRLFPPAYAAEDDDELEAEYRRLMGGDLQDRRRGALQTMLMTLDSVELEDDEAQQWLVGLNELRLVLGTKLDVQEDDEGPSDPADPRAYEFAVYQYLTELQAVLIDQLPL